MVKPPVSDRGVTTRWHACDQTAAARAAQRATVLGPRGVAMIAASSASRTSDVKSAACKVSALRSGNDG